MSLLSQLKNSRKTLKPTEIKVTQLDGKQCIENKHGTKTAQLIETVSTGYVIDTKPDSVPALVIDNLFIGSQDCLDEQVLKDYNIKYVLSIGIEPYTVFEGINYKFVECLDLPETKLIDIISRCIPIIDGALLNKHNILIHCNAGVSRSVSVTIGYLIIRKMYSFDQAYSLIKSVRSCAKPNNGFLKQLKQLKNND